jgi:hypothetical protein
MLTINLATAPRNIIKPDIAIEFFVSNPNIDIQIGITIEPPPRPPTTQSPVIMESIYIPANSNGRIGKTFLCTH